MCTIMCYCSAEADYDLFLQGLSRTVSRGPDASRVIRTKTDLWVFSVFPSWG